ncbi:MAG: response regulator [Deltaproteobacteria bacterium]|nr:response regulator [Deltaproteobacteria bacterium]MBW2072999.1 response regulator [Deltaproteobacteria bacterium]
MAHMEDEILVVDDDLGILESFDAMLGDDYSIVTIGSGEQALEYLSSHRVKLIFLDIKMSDISGIEVLEKLRQQKSTTEVVIVTATTEEHYEQQARDLGIAAFLRKPFEVLEVEEIASRVLH